jgi:hypothetical protein
MSDLGYQAPQPPKPTQPPVAPPRSAWPTVVIFACLALGFLASAVEFQRTTIQTQRQQTQVLATADSEVEGRMEDVGKFLSDPQTKNIHLLGADGQAVSHAVIAWNAAQQSGYLFCDQLPVLDTGIGYELWGLRPSADPVKIASVQATAGTSVYPFRIRDHGMEIGNRIEITAGPRSATNSALLSGQVD